MRLAELDTDIRGHNQPPGPIDDAKTAIADLSAFLAEHPVIQTENEARDGKLFVDRTRATLGELEDARTKEVKPLNDTVAQINGAFKAASEPLKRIFDELRARLTQYAQAEEARRQREAAEARRMAELAEMEARLAEQREHDAKDSASQGEVGVDVGQAIVEADDAFADADRLARDAARAERNVPVRIGGGFSGRALVMRTTETLILDDAIAAINAIGVTDKIRDAILSGARDYRRLKGELPVGVSSDRKRQV